MHEILKHKLDMIVKDITDTKVWVSVRFVIVNLIVSGDWW